MGGAHHQYLLQPLCQTLSREPLVTPSLARGHISLIDAFTDPLKQFPTPSTFFCLLTLMTDAEESSTAGAAPESSTKAAGAELTAEEMAEFESLMDNEPAKPAPAEKKKAAGSKRKRGTGSTTTKKSTAKKTKTPVAQEPEDEEDEEDEHEDAGKKSDEKDGEYQGEGDEEEEEEAKKTKKAKKSKAGSKKKGASSSDSRGKKRKAVKKEPGENGGEGAEDEDEPGEVPTKKRSKRQKSKAEPMSAEALLKIKEEKKAQRMARRIADLEKYGGQAPGETARSGESGGGGGGEDGFIDDSKTDMALLEGYVDRGESDSDEDKVKGDEAIESVDADGNATYFDANDEVDVALARLASRKSKRGALQVDPQEVERAAAEFVGQVELAYEYDRAAIDERRPAMEKLKMVKSLQDALSKRHWIMPMIDAGLLSALKSWLEILPDKSLPNVTVRTAVLDAFSKLPIGIQELRSSGIGKPVNILSRHPLETPDNRKVAGRLIEEWSRPVFQRRDAYADDDETSALQAAAARRLRTGGLSSKPSAPASTDLIPGSAGHVPKPGDPGFRKRAQIPTAMSMDFVRRPQTSEDVLRAAQNEVVKDEWAAKMNKHLFKKPGASKKQQAVTMGIAGLRD